MESEKVIVTSQDPEGKKKKGVMIAVSWEIKAVMTKE